MTGKSGGLRNGMAAAATALAMLAAGNAGGQDTLDRVTIGGEDAAIAKSSVEISLDAARQIIDVCLDYARERGRRISIFVLEPSGQIVASARMDGQGPVNIETGLMKAKTALYMRDSHPAMVEFSLRPRRYRRSFSADRAILGARRTADRRRWTTHRRGRGRRRGH